MQVAQKNLVYLYCITNKIPKLKEQENLVDKLYCVHHNGLYAITSKVKESEFNKENLKKNLANLEWIKAKASIHERVIEGIMRNSCVIPFKFATLFKTNDRLKAMLGKHAQELRDNLKNIKSKEEWGVKIYCDIERLKGVAIKEENEILKIKKEINSTSPGRAYFLRKGKETLIKDAINKRINKYGQLSFEMLKGLSYEVRINKLLPKEVTERKDDMILNSAFLVKKNKITEFVQAVENLKVKYNDKGLNFDCTGPWPPYNFCNLTKEKA